MHRLTCTLVTGSPAEINMLPEKKSKSHRNPFLIGNWWLRACQITGGFVFNVHEIPEAQHDDILVEDVATLSYSCLYTSIAIGIPD